MTDNVESTEPRKKGKKKLIILLLLVLAVGGGAYFFLFAKSPPPSVDEAAPVEGDVVDGATMTMALAGEPAHFVRISFALVLSEGTDTGTVGKRIQLLQDAALTVISGYLADDLKTGEGLDRLRNDLTSSAHAIYPDGEVIRVVLTEVIVQ